MIVYIIKRLVYVIPIILGVTVFVFSLIYIAPGDPIGAVVSPDTPRDIVESLKAEYGFDKPVPVQYLIWVGNALSGELGYSTATGRPVIGEIVSAMPNTLVLAGAAALIAFVVGSALGGVAGLYAGHPVDKAAMALALAGLSVPYYWFGIVLIVIFSVELNLLPSFGMGPDPSAGKLWGWEQMRYAILPTITLSLVPLGIVAKTVRAAMVEIMSKEFVSALHARGLSEFSVSLHIVKNISPIAISVMGLQLGYLLAGSILVETVFSWPGTGMLLNDAIFRRDLPLLQGTILVLSTIFVLLNLFVDVAQALIDPRMRRT